MTADDSTGRRLVVAVFVGVLLQFRLAAVQAEPITQCILWGPPRWILLSLYEAVVGDLINRWLNGLERVRGLEIRVLPC